MEIALMCDEKLQETVVPLLVDTNTAAAILGLKPQTLREWSTKRNGPITPVKIGNRLRWRLADVNKLAGV